MKLSNTAPKRLFTFGCSFTHYRWASWANILAYELGCEFYNFGKSGAGNYFIANQVTQANNLFNFNKEDLVVVCWTNVSREDRWMTNEGWVTPGNIYSQGEYNSNFVKKYANDIHFALRDFSIIDLTTQYLQNTNFHFLSMCDIKTQINQWEDANPHNNKHLTQISKIYEKSLSKIAPSFYETLWQNNIDNKWNKDWDTIHKNFSDGHPTPIEHLEYLEKTFDYDFSLKTKNAVESLHTDWVNFIKESYRNSKRSHGLHELPQIIQDELHKKFSLKKGNRTPDEMWH